MDGEARHLVRLTFYAVGLAMGASSIAILALGDAHTPITLLSVGLFALGVAGVMGLDEMSRLEMRARAGPAFE